MALFLQEEIEQLNVNISIEEAYEGLLETITELQFLNENLLLEDFVLHEQTLLLTESEKYEKEVSFLTKVVANLKRFINKVIENLNKYFRTLLKTSQIFWKMLLDKLNLHKIEEVEVPQGTTQHVADIAGKLQTLSAIAGKQTSSVVNGAVSNTKDLLSNTKRHMISFKNLTTSKLKEKVELIPIAKVTKIIAMLTTLVAGQSILETSMALKKSKNDSALGIEELEIKLANIQKEIRQSAKDKDLNANKRLTLEYAKLRLRVDELKAGSSQVVSTAALIGEFLTIFRKVFVKNINNTAQHAHDIIYKGK